MSGQTLSEKILSRAAKKEVKAGEFVMANIDGAMIHDITGPLAVKGFYEIAGRDARVWDPSRIVLLFDHQVPADSLKAAENHIQLRKFAEEQGILNYDIFCGVCHQVMPEKGHVLPGSVIVGTDSHTCTYGALGSFATGVGSTDMASVFATGKLWFMVPKTLQIMIEGQLPSRVTSKDAVLRIIGDIGADGANYLACEFRGEAAERMSIPERMTVSNMAIEMGAKVGIFPADGTTNNYLQGRVPDREAIEAGNLRGDEDATFSRREWNVSDLEPQIAMPHNVDNVLPISQVPEIRIDQVFLGSCTNGRFEDLQLACEMMKNEPLAKGVRMIVVPASRDEYMKCLRCRPGGEVYGSGGDGGVALLRPLHGWELRPPGSGRALSGHLQPELRGQAGKPPGIRLPLFSRHCRSERHHRLYHRSQGDLIEGCPQARLPGRQLLWVSKAARPGDC